MSKQQEILDFIKKTVGPSADSQFDPDQDLLESGLLDSVAMMEVIVWLEDHFGIRIDTDDLTRDNFSTVIAIARYVERASIAI